MALALATNCRSEPWTCSPSAVVVTASKLKAKSTPFVTSRSVTPATCSELSRVEASSTPAVRPPKQGPSKYEA
jgi:hypothetical protein